MTKKDESDGRKKSPITQNSDSAVGGLQAQPQQR